MGERQRDLSGIIAAFRRDIQGDSLHNRVERPNQFCGADEQREVDRFYDLSVQERNEVARQLDLPIEVVVFIAGLGRLPRTGENTNYF